MVYVVGDFIDVYDVYDERDVIDDFSDYFSDEDNEIYWQWIMSAASDEDNYEL